MGNWGDTSWAKALLLVSWIIIVKCPIVVADFSPDTIKFQNRNIPRSVDLTNQLTHPSMGQTGGTCHIFAAAELFEAACYRKTGVHVDLSRAYLFYKHFKENAQYQRIVSGKVPSGHLTDIDGANDPLAVVDRIEQGDVCTQGEGIDSEEFFQFIANTREDTREKYYGERWPQTGMTAGAAIGAGLTSFAYTIYQRRKGEASLCKNSFIALSKAAGAGAILGTMTGGIGQHSANIIDFILTDSYQKQENCKNEVCGTIDTEAKRRFPIDSSGTSFTRDQVLKQCLTSLRARRPGPLTQIEMVELLSSGLPLVCGGELDDVLHTGIAVGYRENPNQLGSLQFKIRPYQGKDFKWYSLEDNQCFLNYYYENNPVN